MTTPAQRLARFLSEGARFKVELPGQLAIDITPDVLAMLGGLSSNGEIVSVSPSLDNEGIYCKQMTYAGSSPPVSISRGMCQHDFPHNGGSDGTR